MRSNRLPLAWSRDASLVFSVKLIVGLRVKLWDDNVLLGGLIGSNLEDIEKVIPDIRSLLKNDLGYMPKNIEVVIGTYGIARDQLQQHLRPDHIALDLINSGKRRRPAVAKYEGICG